MQLIKIPLNKLLSPKKHLDLKKRGASAFLQLVQQMRSGTKYEPITVCAALGGLYYIQDGVHRSKAAELAGKKEIDAILFRDSNPSGIAVTLDKVTVDRF